MKEMRFKLLTSMIILCIIEEDNFISENIHQPPYILRSTVGEQHKLLFIILQLSHRRTKVNTPSTPPRRALLEKLS